MRKITQFSAVAVLATALSALVPVDASAAANRTFVSGQGSDSNPCSLGAPCRSFAQAITQTAPGGEITVLDSAGYGAVTIAQSVTITGPGGVEAGITATSGENAITIDATSAVTVTLRGLTLEGGGVGNNGINLTSTAPGTLNIIDCVVKDFTGSGVAIEPATPGTDHLLTSVVIANTFALGNTLNGIDLAPQTAHSVVVASIYQTTANGNGTGIALKNDVLALISNSHVEMNFTGISLDGTNEVNFTSIIKNSTVQYNGVIDLIMNSGQLTLANNNTIGALKNMGGSVITDGTNNIIGISGNALIKQAQQ